MNKEDRIEIAKISVAIAEAIPYDVKVINIIKALSEQLNYFINLLREQK